MIGIKIHQLSIQKSVIGRDLGLPLQGDLDGYSKACDFLMGGGGCRFLAYYYYMAYYIILGYVTIFFLGGGG